MQDPIASVATSLRESEEPSVFSIAIMKQTVVNALLDGPQSLTAVEGTQVYLGEDEFILLAAIPAVMRREYLSRFRCKVCLIKSKLLLASREDWMAWVTSITATWSHRR